MTKYNNIKTTINKITFDSKAEAQYYLILLDKKNRGEITNFDLQPKFLLQEGFKKNGKKFLPIHYIADFRIIHNDGSVEIVDVKGVETETFRLKRKMFEFKHPNLSLTIVKGDSLNGQATKKKKVIKAPKGTKTPRTRGNMDRRV